MPMSPLKPCRYTMCPTLTRNGYCERHKKERYKQQREDRPQWHKMYENKRWRDNRLSYLRGNPLCVICHVQGRLTPAYVVDHIKDHKGDYDLFWDTNNWQSLCASCHSSKTAKEN